MDRQNVLVFTRRLSQCNPGEMIVIMYDIFFAYEEDVRTGFKENDNEFFKEGIRNLQRTLDELIGSLDMSYDLAKTLHPLYSYCKRMLAMAQSEHRLEKLDEVHKIMEKLYVGFSNAALKDKSEPIMCNTQKVYAGMTYGRNQLNESCVNNDHRGFLV